MTPLLVRLASTVPASAASFWYDDVLQLNVSVDEDGSVKPFAACAKSTAYVKTQNEEGGED